MDEYINHFRAEYWAKLCQHLEVLGEDGLEAAYQCGKKAVGAGLGLLDFTTIHQEAFSRLVSQPRDPAELARRIREAGAFFREALTPFEAIQRGFREAGSKYSQLNQELEQRNRELAESNRRLEGEISSRKRTEEALRGSEEHYRQLFQDARAMQEDLRSLSHRILQAQEDERKRISRELHDEVGQELTAINVNLTVLQHSGQFKDQQVMKRLLDTQQIVRETMDTVHRFSKELRPPHLDDLGLVPALRSYSKTFSERTGLRVYFTSGAGVEKLGSDEKIVLYRAAQEGLTNVARHAEATQVRVKLRNYRDGVRLEIQDNGKSFVMNGQTPGKGSNRLGLLGMQERVRLVNGRMDIKAEPGKGTLLSVSVPFKAPKIPVPEFRPGVRSEPPRAYT